MDKAECRAAAKLRVPVISNGIEYRRISAIIEVYPDDVFVQRGIPPHVMLELQSREGNSRTVVQPHTVEVKDREMFEAMRAAFETGK